MKTKSGFTIVELLIVIVVIAILAAITIVAFNGIRLRAQASAIGADLRSTEKAFRLYAIEKGFTSWPLDTEILAPTYTIDNPSLNRFIAYDPAFTRIMNTMPASSDTYWSYDNDGNTKGASTGPANGTNIMIGDMQTSTLPQAIDDAIDDGNLSTGKIRWVGPTTSTLFYTLSNSSSLDQP